MRLSSRSIGPRARRVTAAGILAVAALLAACQELDVTNPNDPDRVRATSSPAALEALAAGTFVTWWEWVHDDSPVWAMSTMADEFTSAFFDFGILVASSEPRVPYNNSPTYEDAAVNRDPWSGLYATLSATNDVLQAIDQRGVRIVQGGVDRTPRTRAFAKFMQGLSHGYLALYFDQVYVTGESADPKMVAASPYRVAMDTALAELDSAIAIATANSFTLPADGWLFQEMTSAEFARLAHSYKARLMAQVARTRAERDAVSWAAVLAEAEAGIQRDFAPTAVPGLFFDDFKRVAARSRSTAPGDFARVDYWLVGPADSTNRFREWVAKPPAERAVFQLVTKDRRIHPAGQPAGRGSYLGYTTSNRFNASRGTYHQSRYYFHRLGEGDRWQTGPQLEMTVTEMNLLRAEALIRLGRAAEAVPLINLSRTAATAGLPPVTVAGPPDLPGCVPRKLDGTCGSLWDALRYEKRIEGAGVHPPGAFLDARGWQTLLQGTPVHFPIPGRELQVRGLPLYTFGGTGDGAAPAPDRERCPVALLRCP